MTPLYEALNWLEDNSAFISFRAIEIELKIYDGAIGKAIREVRDFPSIHADKLVALVKKMRGCDCPPAAPKPPKPMPVIKEKTKRAPEKASEYLKRRLKMKQTGKKE